MSDEDIEIFWPTINDLLVLIVVLSYVINTQNDNMSNNNYFACQKSLHMNQSGSTQSIKQRITQIWKNEFAFDLFSVNQKPSHANSVNTIILFLSSFFRAMKHITNQTKTNINVNKVIFLPNESII
jgi:hypothetical protein